MLGLLAALSGGSAGSVNSAMAISDWDSPSLDIVSLIRPAPPFLRI